MISTLEITVAEARGLPVVDQKTQCTDAYVVVSFGREEVLRTEVCYQSLAPAWREVNAVTISDVSDPRLYVEHVVFRVMDKDKFTQDSEIGFVHMELSNLLYGGEGAGTAVRRRRRRRRAFVVCAAAAAAAAPSTAGLLMHLLLLPAACCNVTVDRTCVLACWCAAVPDFSAAAATAPGVPAEGLVPYLRQPERDPG